MTKNSASSRTPEEQRNLDHVLGMFRDVLQPLDATQVDRYISPDYKQHSPMAAPGRESLKAFLKEITASEVEDQIIERFAEVFAIDSIATEAPDVQDELVEPAAPNLEKGAFSGTAGVPAASSATGIQTESNRFNQDSLVTPVESGTGRPRST